MSFKPMPVKKYLEYLKRANWRLEKGSIDWKLYNEKDNLICAIMISHGKNTNQEITAYCVNKTEKAFKQAGLSWPPKKKSKNK